MQTSYADNIGTGNEKAMRILVIEDNRDILANVLDYLQLKGFSVDCAQDGLSGLHLASSGHYDLIVLDVMLPGIDGYQVCRRLREDSRSEVPILMLTARDALEDRLQGLQVGADDYLIKPFALSELVARGSKPSCVAAAADINACYGWPICVMTSTPCR
jgi:DNA-binding response OmpR family regulator